LVVTTNGQNGINVKKQLFTLENNDEEKVEAYTQRNEEVLVYLKEQEIEVEIMYNIDSYRCEIFIHALAWLSTIQALNIVGYIKNQKVIVLIDSGSTHTFIDLNISRSPQLFCISNDRF